MQSGVGTSIRRSRFQHVSAAANCILHGCSAIMCTWPGRTKAYSETALCAGLLHPSTTAPCRWDTNTGTSSRVTRMHASLHPGLRRDGTGEGFEQGSNGFPKPTFFCCVWIRYLLLGLHAILPSSWLRLSRNDRATVPWNCARCLCLTSLGIASIFNSIAPSGSALRNGNDRSRRVWSHFVCTSCWEDFSISWNFLASIIRDESLTILEDEIY